MLLTIPARSTDFTKCRNHQDFSSQQRIHHSPHEDCKCSQALAKKLLRQAVKIQKKVDENSRRLGEDTDAQGETIASKIQEIVWEEINGEDEIMNLAQVVQCITLRISLHFDIEVEFPEAGNNVKYLAQTMNILTHAQRLTTTLLVKLAGARSKGYTRSFATSPVSTE